MEKGDTVSYAGNKATVLYLDYDGGQVMIEGKNVKKQWVNFDWLDKDTEAN